MKITGAFSLDSPIEGVATVPEVADESLAGDEVPGHYSVLLGQVSEDENEGDGAPGLNWPVEGGDGEENAIDTDGELGAQATHKGDGDLLDLLLETLDVEFDPNLLV